VELRAQAHCSTRVEGLELKCSIVKRCLVGMREAERGRGTYLLYKLFRECGRMQEALAYN